MMHQNDYLKLKILVFLDQSQKFDFQIEEDKIDDKSPLFDVSIGELEARDAEIIILIKGINDTFSQTVYSRNSYKSSQFLDKRKFVPVKQEVNEYGQVIISVNDIHIFEEV